MPTPNEPVWFSGGPSEGLIPDDGHLVFDLTGGGRSTGTSILEFAVENHPNNPSHSPGDEGPEESIAFVYGKLGSENDDGGLDTGTAESAGTKPHNKSLTFTDDQGTSQTIGQFLPWMQMRTTPGLPAPEAKPDDVLNYDAGDTLPHHQIHPNGYLEFEDYDAGHRPLLSIAQSQVDVRVSGDDGTHGMYPFAPFSDFI
jgi:hypothetical protein